MESYCAFPGMTGPEALEALTRREYSRVPPFRGLISADDFVARWKSTPEFAGTASEKFELVRRTPMDFAGFEVGFRKSFWHGMLATAKIMGRFSDPCRDLFPDAADRDIILEIVAEDSNLLPACLHLECLGFPPAAQWAAAGGPKLPAGAIKRARRDRVRWFSLVSVFRYGYWDEATRFILEQAKKKNAPAGYAAPAGA